MGIPDLPEYPWEQLAPFRKRAESFDGGVVDLSIGSPVDPTPEVIARALRDATDAHGYPATVGSPPLREAIAAWFARRRGVPGLEAAEVLPSIGSKELVALLPSLLGLGPGDVVVHPRAAYPSYAVGALAAGATPLPCDDPAEWPESTRLVWVNSPGNPDGRVLDTVQLARAVSRARELGAVIAGDECYAELGWAGQWAQEPIPSVLDPRVVGDRRTGVLALYSLSKQSNLAGYRAAFAAGDADLIARIANVRKHLGLMVPQPVQCAMIAALADDAHVIEQKERYRARREVLLPALTGTGFRLDGSEAGLYLWVTEGRDCWDSLGTLADLGILAGPGAFYGDDYPQHVRVSLTASDLAITEAARRLGAAQVL